MTTQVLNDHGHHHDVSSKVIFGFWIFILSDCILFSALFAVYVVLRNNTFGGISINQIASLPYVLLTGLFLLTANFTYGLSSMGFHANSKAHTILWLVITFLLGLAFIMMEQHEFAYLINSGSNWQKSAFLSAFFALLGFHWFHMLAALLWMVIFIIQFISQGFTTTMKIRLTCLGMFLHFLNIVWVFIFTVVYLMGAI